MDIYVYIDGKDPVRAQVSKLPGEGDILTFPNCVIEVVTVYKGLSGFQIEAITRS